MDGCFKRHRDRDEESFMMTEYSYCIPTSPSKTYPTLSLSLPKATLGVTQSTAFRVSSSLYSLTAMKRKVAICNFELCRHLGMILDRDSIFGRNGNFQWYSLHNGGLGRFEHTTRQRSTHIHRAEYQISVHGTPDRDD